MVRPSISTISLLAMAACSCSAFAPVATRPLTSSLQAAAVGIPEPPQNNISEPMKTESVLESERTETSPASPRSPSPKPKRKGGGKAQKHNEGIFSPVVQLFKIILGDQELNKVRAKAISMHSDVIGSFVETADTEFGQAVLRRLFELSDKDHDGTIDKEELHEALSALGFSWLKDKQIEGILKRSDEDGNGVLDIDEFSAAAPKTLRTNLVKLAKKNGGELGFLV